MAVLRDIGSSLKAARFQKLVLYNTHGGNSSLKIDVMARDLRSRVRLCARLRCTASAEFRLKDCARRKRPSASTPRGGNGTTAPSVPELVDRNAYTVNYIADVNQTLEDAASRSDKISRGLGSPRQITFCESGRHGRSAAATAENG